MKSALLIDASAIFSALRSFESGKPLNYKVLDEVLRRHSNVWPRTFDLPLVWMAMDPANEGQAKFRSFLTEVMKFNLEAIPIAEAIVPPATVQTMEQDQPRPFIRFDNRISFALARLISNGYSSIVVVSDSYGLAYPMTEAARRTKGSKITLAFFRHLIDPRWEKVLKGGARTADELLDFFDLDLERESLGVGVRMAAPPPERAGLSSLIP